MEKETSIVDSNKQMIKQIFVFIQSTIMPILLIMQVFALLFIAFQGRWIEQDPRWDLAKTILANSWYIWIIYAALLLSYHIIIGNQRSNIIWYKRILNPLELDQDLMTFYNSQIGKYAVPLFFLQIVVLHLFSFFIGLERIVSHKGLNFIFESLQWLMYVHLATFLYIILFRNFVLKLRTLLLVFLIYYQLVNLFPYFAATEKFYSGEEKSNPIIYRNLKIIDWIDYNIFLTLTPRFNRADKWRYYNHMKGVEDQLKANGQPHSYQDIVNYLKNPKNKVDHPKAINDFDIRWVNRYLYTDDFVPPYIEKQNEISKNSPL